MLAASVEITREQEPEPVLSAVEGLQVGLNRPHQSVSQSGVSFLEGTATIIPQTEASSHARGIQVSLVRECRKAAW